MSSMESGAGEARLVGTLYAPVEERAPEAARAPERYQLVCVPLDGSAQSEHALPWARALARRLDARLCFVHVHQAGGDRAYTGRGAYARRENEQRCEESRYVWSKVDMGGREPAAASVVMGGRVPDALLRFGREQHVDLVVMTAYGASGTGHPWLGSVADRVLRSARVPVLVVPVGADAPDMTQMPLVRRVLVPLDGSSAAEEVLAHALTVGDASGASYTLVRVEPTPARRRGPDGQPVPEPAAENAAPVGHAAQRYLDYVAARLRERGMNVDVRVVVDAHAAESVLALAGEIGADLIALTLHGDGGRQRRLLGSVADKVIRGSSRPVLISRQGRGA